MVEKEHLVVRASLELNPSRDTTVDAMKGVAVLSVIAAHCGFPLLLWINPSTFFLVAFFLISGFYLNTKQSWWHTTLTLWRTDSARSQWIQKYPCYALWLLLDFVALKERIAYQWKKQKKKC